MIKLPNKKIVIFQNKPGKHPGFCVSCSGRLEFECLFAYCQGREKKQTTTLIIKPAAAKQPEMALQRNMKTPSRVGISRRGVSRKLSHRRKWRPSTRANGQGRRDLCSTGVLVLICLGSRQSRAIGSLQPGDPASLCANSLKANTHPNQTAKEMDTQALSVPAESVFTSQWAACFIREAGNSPSRKSWMAMLIHMLLQKPESSQSHDLSLFSWLSNFVVLIAFLL